MPLTALAAVRTVSWRGWALAWVWVPSLSYSSPPGGERPARLSQKLKAAQSLEPAGR